MWLRHRIVHRGGWRARLVADVASSTCKFKPIKWEVQDDSTVSIYPKPHRFPPPPDRPDRRAEHVQSGRPQQAGLRDDQVSGRPQGLRDVGGFGYRRRGRDILVQPHVRYTGVYPRVKSEKDT